MINLVVLTSHRTGLCATCVEALGASPACRVARVIVAAGRPPGLGRALSKRWRKLRKVGLLGMLNALRFRAWYAESPAPDLEATCRRLGIPFFEAPYTNSDETAVLLREANADLGVSLGNGIIAGRIFAIPAQGMINLHLERLPDYQNAQSILWPLYFGETETGLTIHRITRTVDGGDILYRETFPIVLSARLADTVRASLDETRRRAPAAVRLVCENFDTLREKALPQTGGRSYTTPTLSQFRHMTRNHQRLWDAGKTNDLV